MSSSELSIVWICWHCRCTSVLSIYRNCFILSIKFSMVYYFNNSINVAHFDIALLLLHCCSNNSSQFLEDKIQKWVFSISGFLIKSLTSSQIPHKKLCNSRHSYVIDVKLEPLLKLDKKGTLTSKKMTMTISSFFFNFRRIWSHPNVWSVIWVFFIDNCLTSKKSWKKELKNSWTRNTYYCVNSRTLWWHQYCFSWILPPNFEFFGQFSLRINQQNNFNIRYRPHYIWSRTKTEAKITKQLGPGWKRPTKLKKRNFHRKKI